MAHIVTIDPGGEIYLPLARSRLTAIRARGTPHGEQKFIVDGFLIEVRVVGNDDFIRISGGSCLFEMETGLLEAPYSTYGGGATPESYDAARYYESTNVTIYNAKFTEYVGPKNGATGTYRTNPGEDSVGQFSGELTRTASGFKGKVYVGSTSRAIRPKQVQKVVPGTNPPAYNTVDEDRDEAVLAKKITVDSYPASTFTGRCRLWVQSMYGLHLYNSKGELQQPLAMSSQGLLVEVTKFIPVGSEASKGAAQIALERQYNQRLEISTSSGVWLDKASGKHWLFNPSNKDVNIYPLIANQCGESARKFLRDDCKTPLSADDKKHLESYILSVSRPDRSKVRNCVFKNITGGSPMAYGWHWNYTGNRADIALSTEKQRPVTAWFGLPIMESTHWGLFMSHTVSEGVDYFSFKSEKINGPSEWMIDRGGHCILVPARGGGLMEKATPWRGTPYGDLQWAGDGTFYVFYVGDTLQRCSVNIAFNNARGPTWDSSNTDEITPFEMNLRGKGGTGWFQRTTNETGHYVVKFICGPVVAGELTQQKLQTGVTRSEGGTASLVGDYVHAYVTSIPYGFGSNFEYGAIIGKRGQDFHQTVMLENPPFGAQESVLVKYSHWPMSIFAMTKFWHSTAVITIPAGDAEAVFVKTYRHVRDDYTQNVKQIRESVGEAYSRAIYTSGGFIEFAADAWRNDTSPTISSTTGESTRTTIEEEIDRLVCNRGAIAADPEVLGAYQVITLQFTADDTVPLYVKCLSGTGPDCAVIADAVKPVGYTGKFRFPAIVGWA